MSIEADVVVFNDDGILHDFEKDGDNLQNISDKMNGVFDPSNNAIRIIDQNNSISSILKQGMTSTELFISERSGTNNYIIHPRVISENNPLSNYKEIISQGNKLIQVFKASSDTFDGADFLMNYQATGSDPIIDLIEGYTSEAEIDAIWVSTDNNQIDVNYQETSEIEGSTQQMTLWTNTNAERDSVTKTYSTPQDWSEMVNVTFWWKQDKRQNDIYYYLRFIDDNGQKVEYKIVISSENQWEFKDYKLSDFYVITNGTFDWSIVKDVEFYCFDADKRGNVYIDSLQLTRPSLTGLNAKFFLYEYNGTSEPTGSLNLDNDFTLLSNDQGDNYIEFLVDCVKECKQSLHFERGIENSSNKLTIGRYYALVLEATSTENLMISAYDSSGATRKYESAPLFSVNSSNAMTELSSKSMRFMSYSSTTSNISSIAFSCDAEPKSTSIRIVILEDEHISQMIIDNKRIYNALNGTINFSNVEIDSSSKLIIILEHDIKSLLEYFNLDLIFTYEPVTLNN